MKVTRTTVKILKTNIEGACTGVCNYVGDYYYKITQTEYGYEAIAVGELQLSFNDGYSEHAASVTFHFKELKSIPTIDELYNAVKNTPKYFNEYYKEKSILYSIYDNEQVWRSQKEEDLRLDLIDALNSGLN